MEAVVQEAVAQEAAVQEPMVERAVMQEAMVKVKDLVVERGGRRILDVADLSFPAGQVTGIVGPNGAGKSTLLLVLAGLERDYRGEVWVNGSRLEPRQSLAHRRRLGVVFQEPQVLDNTALTNAMLPLRFRGVPGQEARKRAMLWLERLGIAHLAQRPARSLSGGEKQRLALARALAPDPHLLLLDEPFSSVDAPTRAGLIRDVGDLLKTYGITAVVVSHDFTEVMSLSHRVVVLVDGRVRQVDTPREVFYRPADPEVARFLGMDNIWEGEILRGTDGGERSGPCRVRIRGAGDGRKGVELSLATPHRPGSVRVGLRPEAVALHPSILPGQGAGANSSAATDNTAGSNTPSDNAVAARVKGIVPAGPYLRVEMDAGIPLVGLFPPGQVVELRVGDEAVVSIPPAALHVFGEAGQAGRAGQAAHAGPGGRGHSPAN